MISQSGIQTRMSRDYENAKHRASGLASTLVSKVAPVLGTLSLARTASAAGYMVRRNPVYAIVGAVGVGLVAGLILASMRAPNTTEEDLPDQIH